MATSPSTDIKEPIEEAQDLFAHRLSLELIPENAQFRRSQGGLISLELIRPTGERDFFERIVPVRAFPISAPESFISIREPDSRTGGRGAEIGMIEDPTRFPAEVAELLRDELSRRYFTPAIRKIHSFREKFGFCYWDVTTAAGRIEFIMTNPTGSIRTLEDGRVFLYDIDGNCFTVEDPTALDKRSYRMLENYL